MISRRRFSFFCILMILFSFFYEVLLSCCFFMLVFLFSVRRFYDDEGGDLASVSRFYFNLNDFWVSWRLLSDSNRKSIMLSWIDMLSCFFWGWNVMSHCELQQAHETNVRLIARYHPSLLLTNQSKLQRLEITTTNSKKLTQSTATKKKEWRNDDSG